MKFLNNKSILYFLPNKLLGNKIASFDLDHTLIRPNNNRVHPKNIDDFELVFENVVDKLK